MLPLTRGLDKFTQMYIETALWTTYIEAKKRGESPLASTYGIYNIARESLSKMTADCWRFQKINADDIAAGEILTGFPVVTQPLVEERAGHEFWLTRNKHSSGLWVSDWPSEASARLIGACKAYPQCELYVGDKNLLHIREIPLDFPG